MQSTGQYHRSIDGTLGNAIGLLGELISFPSVSATTNVEITDWCENALEGLGFRTWRTEYRDGRGTRKSNLVAVRMPRQASAEKGAEKLAVAGRNSSTGLAYFCHTDVVPAEHWNGPAGDRDAASPFCAVVTKDRIYGRGACDMKGSAAAMLSAVARVDVDVQSAPLWFVCTADEEVGFIGAKHLAQHCPGYRSLAEANPLAIIGEPTELDVVYAHKGIQGFTLRSHGKAGHSATGFGINANEAMVPVLNKLLDICHRTREIQAWQDDRFDPPTLSWNFGVSDHSEVANITPERSDAWVSLRTMPSIDGKVLMEEVETYAESLGLTFRRSAGCDPLWNEPDSEHVQQMQQIAGTDAKTVCYATDGGVLGELSRRIVIGPGSIEQAHTTDEFILIDQLSRGIDCYEKALRHWCT